MDATSTQPRTVPVNVAVIGLGPIGLAVAAAVTRDPSMRLAALVDVDPNKVGRRLTDLGETADSDVAVISDIDALDAIDIAILCTGSHFDRIAPTLRQLMRLKAHVVSSCEEMTWPWLRHPHLADVMNGEAKKAGVALIGTGVNPGFVMDVLPLTLSSMVTDVKRVRVTRVVDALMRRVPLQRKVGATMTVKHFNDLAKENRIGHMGLGESIVLVAQGLGRHPMRSEVQLRIEPVIAERPIECAIGIVQPGDVCGMRNVGTWSGGGIDIELDLTMALAAKDPRDHIEVVGDRTITAVIPGSTPGDTATVAALVNVARVLPQVSPGLKTMLDLPMVAGR